MGKKTNSERLREYIGNRNSEEKKSSVSTQQNSDYIRNLNYQRTINFDTLNTDLTTMGKTLTDIQNGWQTPETMKNTLSSVQSMYNRLGKYQEYQQKYGGADLSELHTAYKSVLDSWDDLSTAYSGFKNAESFDKAKKEYQLSEKFKGLTYDQVQEERKKYKPDSDEYRFLHGYSQYTDLADFDKAMKHATPDVYAKLETARNKHKLDHAFDTYKPLMQNKDFAEKSKYVPTDKKGLFGGTTYGDPVYEFINNVDNKRNYVIGMTKEGNAPTREEQLGYDRLNPEEVATYNYLYNTDKKSAQKFLEDMEITLSKRVYDANTQTWKDNSEGFIGGSLSSILSVPASVFGSIPSGLSTLSDAIQGKEYNPYSPMKTFTNYAQDTRKYVGENIEEATEGWDIAGMNIPSFLYSTGMSIADNLVGAATLQQAYLPLMGMNAFHQKAKEMTEAGEDSATIYKTALASGAAEMVFEKLSLDHFLKIKDVDGIGKIIYNTLTQAGIEGSEELATELANIISDSAIRGKDSELVKLYEDLIKRGYTDKEATTEVAKHIGSQVTWASIGGALSGGVMGFVGATANYVDNSATGKLLKDNEQAQTIFDIANTSEMETAFEAYNQYVGKGATAETISNAKLGNLYNKAKGDVKTIANSELASDELRATGGRNAFKLAMVDNAVKEGIDKKAKTKALEKSAKKNFNVAKNAEESVVTETGKAITFKDITVSENDVTVATENGNISIDEATLSLRDAEVVEMASQIAKTDGVNLANTFLHNYDGETNLAEYENSFNLAIAYAKNDFSYKTMFDKKGSLSAEMVSDIYKEVRVKADQEKAQKIAELNQKMADMKFYKGVIDDSIIDYENTSAEGKINWNDLDEKQRQGITFIKGFAQATGINLVIAHDIRDAGFYDADNNTITIDVANWQYVDGMVQNTILPTLSHETTHWMRHKSPDLWRELNNVVFSTLVEHYNNNTEAKIDFLNEKHEANFSESDVKDMQITEEDLINKEVKRIMARNKKNGVPNDDVEALRDEAREEIIARACEDVLSMSKEGRKIFNSLSVKEQNTLAEKIKEIIKNLMDWVDNLLHSYKSEQAEAKILRQYKASLEEAVEIWDKMLAESVVANQSLEKSGAYKHNVSEAKKMFSDKIVDGKHVVWIEENILKENKGQPIHQFIADYIAEHIGEAYTIIESGQKVYIGDDLPNEYTQSKYTKNVLKNNPNIIKTKNRASVNLGEMIEIAINRRWEKTKHEKTKDAKYGMYRYDTRFGFPIKNTKGEVIGANIYKAELVIRNASDGRKYLYDIVEIKKDKVSSDWMSKKISSAADYSAGQKNDASKGIIRNSDKNVKEMFSEKNIDVDTQIKTSMTMDEAKQMIQRAFVIGGILKWYEGEYKNGDEWLRGQGVSEVALNIENEYTLTEKYLNKLQGYIDGDFYVEDILEAYLKGTLIGKEKPKAKRLDVSQELRINDKRFYSPQQIKAVKKLLPIAMQRVTDKNRKEVSNARARILLFFHNKGASELLGMTQTELNKKLRAWSNYSAKAREISKKFNNGVADSNKWTGIENCSWLYKSTISTKDLESLVKSITGAAGDYEKMYIARTMLALDTHIDWSWLTFEFDTYNNVNKGKTFSISKCLGYYRNEARKIVVSHDKPNTVAHEMGHALDYQWARDLGYSSTALTEVSRFTEKLTDADEKQFFENFRIFIDSLTDNSDIRSEYTQDPKEVFARFVARFVQWVDNTATGNHSYNYEVLSYNDKFTASNYIEFVKLLQEKAMLDAKKMEANSLENVRFSEKDTTYMNAVESGDVETASRLIEEAAERAFSNSKVRGSDGKLRLVYHGTVNEFTVFKRQFANIEGDFGKGYYFTSNEYDVDANYANEEGPDLKNKIARLAERLEWEDEYSDLSYEEREEIARERLITSEPNTITAYLNMENPVYITSDEQGTFLDYNEAYDEEYDEYGEPEGLLIDFVEALQNISQDYAYNDVDFSFIYEYAYDNGGVYASDIVKTIKQRLFDELTDDNGDIATNEVIRLAFEEIGFDGIIDTSVYYKFRNMNGMDSGTTHYIVFDETQIKSADIATYDDNGDVIPLSERFNTEHEDIRYSEKNLNSEENYGKIELNWHTDLTKTQYKQVEEWIRRAGTPESKKITDTACWYKGRIDGEDLFVIYSTENSQNPTILYERKGKESKMELDILLQRTEELENGRLISQYINTVLSGDWTKEKLNLANNNVRFGRGPGNTGYASVLQGKSSEFIGSKAFRNVIKNLFEIQERARIAKNEIRHAEKQVSTYDLMGESDRLLRENQQFRAEIERLRERLAIEKKVTGGTKFNENQLGALAGHLRKISGSNIDKVELMKALKEVYTYIVTAENLAWDDVYEKCYSVAQALVKEAKPIKVYDPYSEELLKEIRNTRVSFDETQKKEAAYLFDKNWNRAFFGKIVIADDAINIESKWQEWASLYPDIFTPDVGNNHVSELYSVIESLRESVETVDKYAVEEQTRWLAEEVYNGYWNISPIRTTADKYDKQIKRLNFEHRQRMSAYREEYEKRLAEQGLADDIYYGRKLGEQKTKYEKELADKKVRIEKQKELYKKLRDRKNEEIALAKAHGRDKLTSYKENAERKTYIQRIVATLSALNKKLLKNDKDVHIPEALKPVVISLINAVDLSSKQMLGMEGTNKETRGTPTKQDIEYENTFGKTKAMADENATLKQAIQDALELFENAEKVANNTSDGTWDLSIVALDVDLIKRIKEMIKSIDVIEKNYGEKFALQQMSLDHLKTLNAMAKSISTWANNVDYSLSMKHKARISESGANTCEENDVLGKRKQYIEAVESVKGFFSWSNLTPVNAFKRLGNTAMKYFDSLRDAQDRLAFNQEAIITFTKELFKGKEKEILKWREDVKEFTLTLPTGETKKVRMPVSYVMTLYCVSKQEDAKRHLYGMDEDGKRYEDNGGGMTIKAFKEKKSLEVTEDIENTIMTESLIRQITSTLTDEQIKIADELQRFMNDTGSKWGDEVSMILYGIKKFDIENYFPITVSPNTIKVLNPQDKRQSIHFFSILNFGFTKSRNPNAKQSIEIGDIIEVFANHMSMVAIYNAYALPIYDLVRWFNYKGRNAEGKEIGVTTSIERAFGKEATRYIGRLISDLNGQHESSRLGFITKIFRNTKLAMVGNSISVALLQPTAYLKAMTKIPTKYLLKSALYIKDFGVRHGREKAKEWCGIALWKSRNNFDTDISRNVTSEMLPQKDTVEKLKEWSLWGAGKLDELTWGVLWNACEFEVRATRKDLKVGDDEFFETVASKLRDVIYETQVVDSPLTRSDIMRSPDNLAKMLTMFGSEATVAYNMVHEAFVDAKLYTKRNGKKGAFKRNAKTIGISLLAYTLTSAAGALFTTIAQAIRDDEKDEKEMEDYIKMYFSNFLSDWLIFGKIPYVKETLNYAQGYSASRPDSVWIDSSIKAIKYFAKAFDGKEGAGHKAIKESLKAMSYLSGLPMYNFYRDTISTLDSFKILEVEDVEELIDEIFN